MQPTDTHRAHCIDPETLAAWVEGGLPAPEAGQVEIHLSACARCQAMLAAFSRMDAGAAPAAKVVPFLSRPSVKWAAAGLAAAASLMLWTWTRPGSIPASSTADGVAEQAPSAPAPELPPAEFTIARVPPPAATQRTVAPPPPVVAPPDPIVVPPIPPPQATPPPPPPALSAAAFKSTVAEPATFEVVAVSEQSAPGLLGVATRQGAGRGGGAGGAARLRAEQAALEMSPARWRVTRGAVVERSTDHGKTWEAVTIDPPVVITAGSAPYRDVCWLAGRDGVVLRSTNGTSFERMTPPDNVDLMAIQATDALRATVTAADGRVFVTVDGGATWSPLQGFPPTPF